MVHGWFSVFIDTCNLDHKVAAKGNTNCAFKLGPGRCALESTTSEQKLALAERLCLGKLFHCCLAKDCFLSNFSAGSSDGKWFAGVHTP